MIKWKRMLSIGLAMATLTVVLTYVLGAQVILQSAYTEPAHGLFMSIYTPLIQGIAGSHGSMSQMHDGSSGPAPQSHTGADTQTQNQFGIIGNNILGSPAGFAAGGFAAVVVIGATTLVVVTYIISWNQKSFVVSGLLAASGISLMILPLANMNFVIPGPIIGVIVGIGIFGLGAEKGIRTTRAATAAK